MIGVIGLGYMGLLRVSEFIRAGCKVLGFDVDARNVKSLKAGKSYIEHISSKGIADMVRSGQFEPTADFDRLKQADCILIRVPITHKQREHNLEMSGKKLSAGMLHRYDAVLIATGHSVYDYGFANSKLIIDTRNATAKMRKGREKILMD